MTKCRLAAVLVASWCLFVDSASANPVDLSAPSGELGASNARGFLEIWREVDGVGADLGKGSYLPLRYRFSTESDRTGALGAGFYVPMFESRNVLIREDTMLANLPCGKKVYLWRDPNDSSKFQTPDREWKGSLDGDNFTLWRDDGWKVFYRQGRLASILSDDHRTSTWSYDDAGGCSVEQDGKSIITMEPGPGGQIADFVFENKSYKVAYGKRPITEVVGGQGVLKEIVSALTKLEYPDGKAQTFDFGLTAERVPKLTAKDVDGTNTDYTWDAGNSHIATEKNALGEWTYKVGGIASTFDLPALSRTNSQGRIEGSIIDNQKGTYTEQAEDGTVTITHVFTTPGPLYQKVRSVEQITGGVTSTIYRASYDGDGRLIRKMDDKGFVLEYSYDTAGKFLNRTVKIPSDPAILSKLKGIEAEMLAKINSANDAEEHSGLLEELAFFYIHDCGSIQKALALLPSISVRKQAFNVQLHAIDGDLALNGKQKAEKLKALKEQYPEQDHILTMLIEARLRDDVLNSEQMDSQGTNR